MTVLAFLLMAAAPQVPPEAAKPEPKVCRNYPVLGSRAKRERVCRTRAEWRGLDDEQRRVGTETVERSRLTTIVK